MGYIIQEAQWKMGMHSPSFKKDASFFFSISSKLFCYFYLQFNVLLLCSWKANSESCLPSKDEVTGDKESKTFTWTKSREGTWCNPSQWHMRRHHWESWGRDRLFSLDWNMGGYDMSSGAAATITFWYEADPQISKAEDRTKLNL